MNRTILAVVIAAAFLPLPASGGSAPWRHTRVYGWEIMSKQERLEFRDEMRSKVEYEDQLAFWRQHIKRMQDRAWHKGLLLDAPNEIVTDDAPNYRRPIFASYLMTGEEVEGYRAKERTLRNKKQREDFLREHEKTMQAKAWAKGLPIGPTPAERKLKRKEREAALK